MFLNTLAVLPCKQKKVCKVVCSVCEYRGLELHKSSEMNSQLVDQLHKTNLISAVWLPHLQTPLLVTHARRANEHFSIQKHI